MIPWPMSSILRGISSKIGLASKLYFDCSKLFWQFCRIKYTRRDDIIIYSLTPDMPCMHIKLSFIEQSMLDLVFLYLNMQFTLIIGKLSSQVQVFYSYILFTQWNNSLRQQDCLKIPVIVQDIFSFFWKKKRTKNCSTHNKMNILQQTVKKCY